MQRRPNVLIILATVIAIIAGSFVSVSPVARADDPAAGACTIVWDGGAGSAFWLDAANWSDDRLPTYADNACVYSSNAPTGGITLDGASNQIVNSLHADVAVRVSMSADAGLRLVGQSSTYDLYVDSGYVQSDYSLDTANVYQTGGAVGGAGGITVHGAYHWSGGRMWGTGWTSVAHWGAGNFGLFLEGGGQLWIDQRLLESQYGVRWSDNTLVSVTHGAYLRTFGTSLIEAPGAYVDGQGTFDNHGGIEVAAGANVTINAAYATVDAAWWHLNDQSNLTLAGTSVVDGDVRLVPDSTLTIGGDAQFTAASEITGGGSIITTTAASKLVSDGKVAVGSLAPQDGTMTFGTNVTADSVDAIGGTIEMQNGTTLDTHDWSQYSADFRGAAHVSGDAALDSAGLAGEPGNSATFTVDGALTVTGLVTAENIDVKPATLTFDDDEGASPPEIDLIGAHANVTVAGTATSAVDATVYMDPAQTHGGFGAGTLDITAGTFDLDAPMTVGPDDTLTVGESAELRMSNLVQRGTMTVAGGLDLTGGAQIERDIDGVGAAAINFESTALTTLVAGATVGGSEAIVTNDGSISGQGGLIGDVLNNGVIDTDGRIDVLGNFEQAPEGELDIHVDGPHHGSLDVVGNADLAGKLVVTLADGGALPTDPFDVLTASGTIAGEFDSSNGLERCGELDYATHAVTIVPQPCVAVAAGSAQENAGHVDFVVSLSEPSSSPVVVHYGVVPGTADITDYVDEPSGSLTIPAGQTTGTISIGLVDDENQEGDETFTLTYTVDGGEAQAADATGTILDDDFRLTYNVKSIPVPGGLRYITGLGTEYVLGAYSPDADTDLGWAYRITDDHFAGTRGNFMGSGMNSHDQAVGDCGVDACIRDHLVDTTLDQPHGVDGSAEPQAINDNGEIVGYLTGSSGSGQTGRYTHTAALWADAKSSYQTFSALGSDYEGAVDVNADGVIVGNSVMPDGTTHGWVRYTDGSVVDIGTLMGLPKVSVVGISDDGVVAGVVSDGALYSENFYGFTWTAEHGMISLGLRSYVGGIAPDGDMTGHIEARAFLWHDGKAIDLNKALGLDPADGFILTSGMLINDQGTIVALGAYHGYETVNVLLPDGAGCRVCLNGHLYEHEFPTGALIDAGDTIVEGNPTELFADIANNDDVARTVNVSFIGVDGQPLTDPRTLTVAAHSSEHTYLPFDTEGLAWKNGVDAGPIQVSLEMRDTSGSVMSSQTFETRVIPRPVVNVHGMNSDASTWAGYPAFVSNAHFGWKAFAIDTMNTKPWTPNTIAQNAALLDQYVTKIQTEQNAWQVDLVAHSMGGLISRYYIQNLMQDHDGLRSTRQLVMLGTPNAGSPCADVFRVPMTQELRTDIMRQFNDTVTDQRGVPFSIAAGNPLPATCNQVGPGDMVVPLDSALHGVADSQVFPIWHTDMTFSGELFNQFVLPRLDGQHPVATMRAAAGFAPALAPPAAEEQPQLLQTDQLTIAAGDTVDVPANVPGDISAFGVTGLGPDALEIELLKNDVVMATTGTDANPGSFFRNVSQDAPAPGSWKIRVVNHGSVSLDVPLSTWVQGAVNTIAATAEQVGILGTVKVTAHVDGPALAHPVTRMIIAGTDRDGDDIATPIFDNGGNGDAVAGDGIFTGTLTNLEPGPTVITVTTDDAYFYRMTTVGLVLSVGSDGPGNDAPIALPATATVPTGETSRIDLEAADPEDQPLTYEIVTQPAHGKLGGSGPFFDYLPATGYQGTDSFTYRVHDGELYSATVAVSITVTRAKTTILVEQPLPATTTKGSPMHVVLRVKGASLEPISGGDATLTFGSNTVTAPVASGRVDADIPVDLAGGWHDLVVTYSGNAGYLPATITQSVLVVEGMPPVPHVLDINGEAGYTTRVAGLAGDIDNDAVRYQFDFTDDGVFDAELGPNGGKLAYVDHVYPAAFDGHARLRVTDAAGHVVDAVGTVHIAPHRDLGALQRILVDGAPVKVTGASDDGRYVLYQVTDNEIGHQLPVPYGVLDRQTGTSTIVTVRPDGTVDGDPIGATLSPDGRTVAFSSGEWVNGFYAPQVYVRNLDTGLTTLASVNAAGQRAGRGGYPLAVTNGGTKVLFQSDSLNLTSFDIRQCGTVGAGLQACDQLYQRDLVAGTTTVMSDRVGTTVAEVESGAGMSADGRYVAYGSRGLLWFVDTTNGSRSSLPFGNGAVGDRYGTAQYIDVSDNGRFVTFTGEAVNVIPGDDNSAPDLIRYDRQTGTTTVLVKALDGGFPVRGSAFGAADVCADRTAFWSESDEIVPSDTNGYADVFVRESSGSVRRVSVEARDGVQSNEDTYVSPVLTGNGRFVFFQSSASNLVPDDVEDYRDSFVLDLGSTTCGDDTPPPVNHAPVATAGSVATDEDVAVAVALGGSDVDGDALTYSIVSGPSHGSLTGTGANRTYTPAANWSGTDTFTFTASDGSLQSQPATVTITVRPVNDAPVATAGSVATDEDVAVAVALGGSDVEGDVLTYSIVSGPSHGSLTGTGANRTYTPAANWSSTDTFTFTASDGSLQSQPATVTITVRPVNDAPVAALAAPASITEGSTGTLTLAATDIDGDALTYSWATDGGTLVPSAGGTSATLAGGDGPATRHVTVEVSDGTTRVTVAKDVVVTNVAPSVTIVRPAPGAHTTVGTAIELSATTSDVGGDDVTCTIRWGDGTSPATGCTATHSYTRSGTYDATVTADDGDGGVTTAAISIAVDALPDTSWHFEGFFEPVDNLPVVNTVKAGSTIPLKFGLGGDHGLAIFAPGYPASVAHACGTSSAEDAIEQVSSPGESTLVYDAGSDRYHLNWKTEKAWAGQCRTLVLKFVDGTIARAEFRFK